MRKRNTSSRRLRPGLDADQLVNVYEKLSRGEEIGLGERRWLEGLLEDLLADRDVRERFYVTLRGAPVDQGRKFWCAMWIANRPTEQTVTDAKAEAEDVWRLRDHQVNRAWLDHGRQAKQLVSASKNRRGLANVIEYQRQRCSKSP